MHKLIFIVAFHLVVTNLFIHVVPKLHKAIVNIKIALYQDLFIHVVPKLHKVIVNIKIALYFLIQLNEN